METFKDLLNCFNEKDFAKVIHLGSKLYQTHSRELDFLNILSIAHIEVNNKNYACSLLKEAYQINQNDPITLYNLAKIKAELGYIDESIQLYDRLIQVDSKNLQAKNNLAKIYMDQCDYVKSENLYQQCLEISPKYRLALDGICELYQKMRQKDKKSSMVKRCYNLFPNDNEAVLAYISNLIENKNFSLAKEVIKKHSIKNNNVALKLLESRLYMCNENLSNAKIILERIILHHPDSCEAYQMMINCLLTMKMFESLDKFMDIYLHTKKINFGQTKINYKLLATVFSLKKRELEYLAVCNEWLKEYPDDIDVKLSLAAYYLRIKDFKNGFNFYHYRHYENPLAMHISRNSNVKKWDFTEQFKKLIIFTEQGIGDEVMFLQYLDYFKGKNKISLSANHRLKNIIEESYEGIDFIAKDKILENIACLDEYSHYIFLGDICMKYLENNIKGLRKKNGYLKASSSITSKYKKLFYEPNKINIGISWYTNNVSRTLSNLDNRELKLISEILSFNLINLQYGEHNKLSERFNIKFDRAIDYTEDLNAVFGIIKSCDCVLTIDNSLAHFAGSLGIKTYLILPHHADWRWFNNTDKSIFYDSIKLYRLNKLSSYEPIIEMIINDIKKDFSDKIKL